MNEPLLVTDDSFQKVWIKVVNFLSKNNWESWNIIAQISNTKNINTEMHDKITRFAIINELIKPKDVAYTIFPFRQYNGKYSSESLYKRYLEKFYPWTRKKEHKGWGTYFYRMINYERGASTENQLLNIINAINHRKTLTRTGFSIVIPYPGKETIRQLGAPCLNFLSLQLEIYPKRVANLLAIYRNHDFLERAYGNYMGLCKLLEFISVETDFEVGVLTCISSHAYISNKKRNLLELIEAINCN